ncbi:MAG TPA: Gfo/Idh/MocA family oxidoreductase [Bryobacteraceae bacterium]|nr:Gfo/Idh/MocA family oxidoreductase [Bryobacteraceae bacterium]
MADQNTGLTRRGFLPATAAAITIVPRHVLGAGFTAPSDKLNIAAVGVGGMGQNYVKGCASQNIVAIADVDHVYAAPVFKTYPGATIYKDYRVMLEKEKGIDAVIVGTPDHSHAVVASAAIALGKGVYVAKPMTRTVFEARALAKAAREKKVATQMSVQSCSSDPAVTTEEWVKSDAIGKVREVHVWTDRPVWPQGLVRPAEKIKVPAALDWDMWLGPAPERPYHPLYHPFNFRGWYDFGTGGLGDMACHAFHIIVKALHLGAPASVSASSTVIREPLHKGEQPDPNWTRSRRGSFPETFASSSMVTWDFPARGDQPPVRMTWYEGGLRPPRPVEMAPDRELGGDGLLFIGEKGTLWSAFTGGIHFLSAGQEKELAAPPKTLPRTKDHYMEWVNACKGGAPANCNFEFAAPLTEIALLGVIAQRTGKFLEWDAQEMCFPNNSAATALLKPDYRTGWSL